MFKRLVEALKGGTYVVEKVPERITFEGMIPAFKHWAEEPYRLHVWVHEVKTYRDAMWVRPTKRTYYTVEPMTTHRVPIDVRAGSIYVLDYVGKTRFDDAISPEDAAFRFINSIQQKRVEAFQKREA